MHRDMEQKWKNFGESYLKVPCIHPLNESFNFFGPELTSNSQHSSIYDQNIICHSQALIHVLFVTFKFDKFV